MASAKGMNIVQGKPKKWTAILAFLLLIFLIISQPVQMAAFFTSLADGLKQAVSALGAFFRALG